MDDDPYGLGISVGVGGFASGFSASGMALGSASSSTKTAAQLQVERRQLLGDIIDWLRVHRGSHSWEEVCNALHIHEAFDISEQQKLIDVKKWRTVSL